MLYNTKIRFASDAVTVVNLAKQRSNNSHLDNDMKGQFAEDSPSSEYKQPDHPPSSSSSSTSSSGGGGSGSAWQQFLHYHHLAPCRMLIAGASGSGKSALAKGLAHELELQYVDVLETLRWVAVSSSSGDDTSSSSSSTAASTASTSSAAADIKKALLDIMTIKLQEGLKKGAPPVVCDPLTFDYSESFVALVPLPLVRKALALRMTTCSHCKIKVGLLVCYSLFVWLLVLSCLFVRPLFLLSPSPLFLLNSHTLTHDTVLYLPLTYLSLTHHPSLKRLLYIFLDLLGVCVGCLACL